MQIEKLMEEAFRRRASDLHLTVGRPPLLRIDGRLEEIGLSSLRDEDTEGIIKVLVPQIYQEKIKRVGGANFSYNFNKEARFRVSVYKQKGKIGLNLRLLPSRLMTFEDIGLPPIIKNLLVKQRGLILVTGPTGCGKTTTLACMINYIAEQKKYHILTVEDPIEYYHKHHSGIMTQEEVGIDVPSFSEAVLNGLRIDPDVILIGEMREKETMKAALLAAETGHLVLATLHTLGAALTVDRVINAFSAGEQEQVRTQMANCLIAILSQVLIPCASGKGRIAAFELMLATNAIQNLIREKKSFRISSEIQTGKKFGMKTMEDSLAGLCRKKLIAEADAVARAGDLESLQEKINRSK